MKRQQLPLTISSVQDLTALILELREYARWSSHGAVKKRAGVTRSTEPPAISRTAQDTLENWFAKQPASAQSLEALISGLEDLKAGAPTLTITLAALPTNELRQALVAWCREQIAPDVLVNFQFNGTLLGGMVVRYGSHIFDWSFRRRLLAARGKFPEVLRRV